MTGADAILKSLKENGIDYLFVNAGSDFAPIIESYAAAEELSAFPEPLIIPHECVAVGMAHGFYLATGRPQGIMVHVHVGLANAVMGVINARADNVPMVVISGRTPLTEHGRLGARATAIQYGQEMFDQTALVRDVTKFNYELRYAEQASALVNRAVSIAKSEPAGPVYLSLPREPLAEEVPDGHSTQKLIQAAPGVPQPDEGMIKQAAALLAQASNPLMIVQRGDAAGQVGKFVGRMAARHAIKIVESGGQRSVVAGDHPMRIPGKVNPHLPEADVVLVVDASVPWIERHTRPNPDATVIHIGPDPLFSNMPMRSYKTDLAIVGNTAATVSAISAELDMLEPETGERYATIEAEHKRAMGALRDKAQAGNTAPMSADWVGLCLSESLPDDALVFSERGPKIAKMILGENHKYFANTWAGGLGWGVPAAIGAQLVDRERLVVSIVGDGSYMFGNPVACHQVMETYDLPVLTIVLNNKRWNAVHFSTLEVYPDGAASKGALAPLSDLSASPDFVKIAEASRTYAERVENGADLPAALERAIQVIKTEKRAALLEISVNNEMT